MTSFPLSLDDRMRSVRMLALVEQTLAGSPPAIWQLSDLVPGTAKDAEAVAAAFARMIEAEADRRRRAAATAPHKKHQSRMATKTPRSAETLGVRRGITSQTSQPRTRRFFPGPAF